MGRLTACPIGKKAFDTCIKGSGGLKRILNKLRGRLLSAAITVLASAIVLFSPVAYAQNQTVTPYEADASFNAFNANFLVQSHGYTFYNNELKSVGTSELKLWTQALDIAIAEDHYERLPSPSGLQLVTDLLNTFETDFGSGTNWSYDGWNDDIGWMVNAFIRGYRITGNEGYLNVAKKNYDMAYSRGWDDVLGGGIYENSEKNGKECLSNDPFIFEGVAIYEDTGDTSYLTKAEGIYSWVRSHLFNYTDSANAIGASGSLCQGERPGGELEKGDNLYNSGTFLEAANALFHVTKNIQYYNDAILDIHHVMSKGPILRNGSEGTDNQWAYWVVKGLSDFCTENHLWSTYYPYMLANANAAWSARDILNLTWNDWTTPTTDSGASALEMSSAVAIWQVLDVPQQSMIVNQKSGQAMDLTDLNQSNNAPINQWQISTHLDSGQHWMVVPAGGHNAIISADTGMAATVLATSTSAGAQLVDCPFSLNNTSMLWDLVPRADGYYVLKNVKSGLVLDGASGTKVAARIVQAAASGSRSQNWKIRPFVSFAGRYELQCVASGDSVGADTNSAVTQTEYAGTTNQLWMFTPTSLGYYTIRNVKTHSNLSVSGGSYIKGANIVAESTVNGGENQWMPVQNEDGTYCFYNLNSEMVLDDPGGTNKRGAQYDQWGWNGGKNQQFNLIPR